MQTARVQRHQEVVIATLRELEQRGVRGVVFMPGGIDVLVGEVRVAVRASGILRHRVRVAGHRYEYPVFRWNLHEHGARRHFPDFWVLAGEQCAVSAWRYFVLSAPEVGDRLTIQLGVRPYGGRGRPLSAVIHRCENQWGRIVNSVREGNGDAGK